jgi:hypothetical protein
MHADTEGSENRRRVFFRPDIAQVWLWEAAAILVYTSEKESNIELANRTSEVSPLCIPSTAKIAYQTNELQNNGGQRLT